ncbi:MAG: methyltransferase domain-containing protein [Phycisphaerales bacterium]|nr:methyltransferase domain-containing protein [Phycisphaerales bacterium]NNM24527.1 methyltransferase domain-containing protein [Phycisphaerales bacterium]
MSKDATNPTFYNADSTQYDRERWTSKAGERVNRVQQEIVADLTGDWRDDRVLEVGPGTARFTIPLCRAGNRVTILDISAGMLAVAQKNIDEAGASAQLEDAIEGSIYELPFEDAAFDHAISLNVFNHLEHAGDALKELARVTKQGSTLLFNFANLHSYFWAAGRRINRTSKAVGQDVYSVWERPADVQRMIEAAGLDVVRKRGNVHTPRAMEKYRLGPVVGALDRLSRQGPMRSLAPVQYCLCRKR